MATMDGFARHMRAVRNVTLPGGYVPFLLGADQVGWVAAENGATLTFHGCRREQGALVLDRVDALPGLARALADAGAFGWRGETFDVRAAPDGPVLATVDRGALPWFGMEASGVHVNGLVRRPDGLHVWVGRRAADRLMDPGKLDHVTAGGIPAGMTAEQTLIKEGAEEAGLSEPIMRQARPVGVVRYATRRPEGLRRDHLHSYDLLLPDDVRPVPCDGEVTGFELWPIERAIETVRTSDAFKFNVALVLIDLFVRHGLIPEPVI